MKPFSLPGPLLAILLFVLTGCSTAPETKVTDKESLTQVTWSQVANVLNHDTDLSSWAEALEASIDYYKRLKPETLIRFGPQTFSAEEMAKTCQELAHSARTMEPTLFYKHLQEHYLLFRAVGRDVEGDVMVTAYYEPLLHGAISSSRTYAYPIYRRPHDLIEVNLSEWWPEFKDKRIVGRIKKGQMHPYYNREEIDKNRALKGKHLELVWVNDPIDLFFLHIQGSGRVLLTDGSTMRVGYAGTNGQPYRSIGTLLINENQISRANMSLPAIREWLQNNGKQRDRVLFTNPSYVFFKKLEGGPFGNIGVKLTAERSIATDARLFPKGAPGLLYVTLPEFENDTNTVSKWQQRLRFTVNQDTGGAIRGAGRVDYFMGFGDKALRTAGIMKQTGASLYFIAPRPPNEPTGLFHWLGNLL